MTMFPSLSAPATFLRILFLFVVLVDDESVPYPPFFILIFFRLFGAVVGVTHHNVAISLFFFFFFPAGDGVTFVLRRKYVARR